MMDIVIPLVLVGRMETPQSADLIQTLGKLGSNTPVRHLQLQLPQSLSVIGWLTSSPVGCLFKI